MTSHIYLIFPFLETYQPFEIEGVQFKGPFEFGDLTVENFNTEEENDRYHLGRLISSFRLSEKHALRSFTYSIQEITTQAEFEELKKRLDIAVNIIRYKLFDKDERGHITFPQTSLYIFELTENEWISRAHKLPSGRELFWYKGTRDFVEEVNIHFPEDHIFPPKNHMSLGYLQIPKNYPLIRILEKSYWKFRNYSEEERHRTIRAIEHYNRSFSEGTGVDDRDRILSLSAGFEALLNLPDEQIQKSFRSVVTTLLGDIPNLSDWTLEFYNLRSKIIHGDDISKTPRKKTTKKDRKVPSLYYRHGEGEYEYIKHLEIGQNVFRRCLEIILEQRNAKYMDDIIDMLEPTEVVIKHIEEGIKHLKDKAHLEEWYESGLLRDYGVLRAKDWTAKPEKVVKVGKELMTLFKGYLQIKGKPLDIEIDAILGFKGGYPDLAMAYNALDEKFEKIYFTGGTHRDKIEELVLENAAKTFISYASHVLFSFKGSTT